MNKKIILRLFLLIAFGFSLQSCRNDLLPDHQETYNNSSQFKLTSKTIPLSLSKHKAILGTELEKAQTNLQKVKINSFGKTIDYGNGLSIDTDHVIYIENGPNYHTYTFRIIRDNADENSPIENLVLSPLTDGTYRELLVTYNLSPQEKNDLLLRKGVDVKGKMSTTEVTKGTFNNGQLGKSQSCGWVEQTVFVECSQHEHGEWNVGSWGSCTAGTKPMAYTTSHYMCTSMDDGSGTGAGDNPTNGNDGPPYGPGGGNGGGEYDGQGGGYTPTEPCNGTGVLTGPQNPSGDFGDTSGGCSGVPTTPNPGGGYNGTDPCEKAKASMTYANSVLKNTDVKTKMDAVLRGKATAALEYSIAVGLKPNNKYDVTAPNEGTTSQSVAPDWNLSNPSSILANGHSHSGTPGNPSAGDLFSFLEWMETSPNYGLSFVYGVSGGVKEVYAFVANDRAAAHDFLIKYPRSENYDSVTHSFLEGSDLEAEVYKMKAIYKNQNTTINTSGENYDVRAVGLAYILEQLNAGMSIAKVDVNGNLKKINASIEPITVNGMKDERAKVSKCP